MTPPSLRGGQRSPGTSTGITTALILVAAVLLAIAGCSSQPTPSDPTATSGNGQTEPTGPTGSSAPTASPSPTRSLSGAEQRAYDNALKAAAKYEALVAAMISRRSIENLNALNQAAVDPWLTSVQNNMLKKLDFDVVADIEREVTQSQLVTVKLDPQAKIRISSRAGDWKARNVRLAEPSPVVVMDVCVTSTVVKPLTKNGKKVFKDSKPGDQEFYESRMTLTQPAYLEGRWAVAWEDAVQVDAC